MHSVARGALGAGLQVEDGRPSAPCSVALRPLSVNLVLGVAAALALATGCSSREGPSATRRRIRRWPRRLLGSTADRAVYAHVGPCALFGARADARASIEAMLERRARPEVDCPLGSIQIASCREGRCGTVEAL